MSLCLLAAVGSALRPQDSELLVGADALGWDPGSGEVRVRTAEGALVAFDVFLRPLERASGPLPADAVAVEGGWAAAPAWAGRTLSLDARAGVLRLGPASWEVPARLRWGPGWLCVEFRGAQPGGELRWSTAGRDGTTRFRCDRADGLWQRAWVEGLEPGQVLSLQWSPTVRVWPTGSAAVPQRDLTIPEVDPAGERPTEAWPSD